jgi:crossover junction endodeoxyribonuclease RuvC
MLIMGIDPGIAISGYGIISGKQNDCSVIEYGVIKTPPGLKMPYMLTGKKTDTGHNLCK